MARRAYDERHVEPIFVTQEERTVKDALSQHADFKDTSAYEGRPKPKKWAQSAPRPDWWTEMLAHKADPLKLQHKVETDIDEVLQAHTIYASVEKGVLAKNEDLIAAFGTDDEDRVCVEILNKGEFQVSDQERQMQTDALFRDVASRVTAMVLNPASQRPYPLSTIERAMRETLHFAPQPSKSAKQQALAVVRQLQQQLGLGILFVTHDLGVASGFCHRVIVLDQGQIVEEGPGDGLIEQPQAPITRQLVAACPRLPHER